MGSQNQLGIYIRKDRATVVALAGPGRQKKLADCFSVDLAGREIQSQQTLADEVARICRERGLKAPTAVVALDCALFMQHTVHSDFADFKKIAATIRFDTEEALATDISDMAVAFRVLATDDEGARLDVFTAERSVLSDIILSLQSNGIDPVAILPDTYCLARTLTESRNGSPDAAVYAMLSDARGYFVGRPGDGVAPMLRAFLVGSSQDRKALLSREALVTTALADSGAAAGPLRVFDASETFTAQDLAGSLPFQVEDYDPVSAAGFEAEETNAVDCAIAFGAALPESEEDPGINFRRDHMPYMGKKQRFERAVRFLSVSLALLFVAVGVYAQTQLMSVRHDRAIVREKLEPDFLAVMPGVPELPPRMTTVVDRLNRELRKIEQQKGGHIDPKSLSAKLTLVLQGINACAAQTDLVIDTITLTPQDITIQGDTSSRPNTLKVFAALESVGLTPGRTVFNTKGDRDTFSVSVEPKRAAN